MIKLLFIFYLFHLLKCSKEKELILGDINFYKDIRHLKDRKLFSVFYYLMIRDETFKDVFYYRIGKRLAVTKKFIKPVINLYIRSGVIGPGLFIQHGFATIISAERIGSRCWINQQVTIGYEQDRRPAIGNNVRICAGAIIIGDVKIGDNSIVGAGAVVTKSIPPGEVWGGNPAHFIKKVQGVSTDNQRINK